ncbi:hypothetical protein ACMXYV_07460 [Neptuniibacter sp. SY11_33]|uniref:hypothetical protein n=1 Tax=Neptuniibacter sp. SY11_33 TaxID=3398215 RepID=UPI0039F4B471
MKHLLPIALVVGTMSLSAGVMADEKHYMQHSGDGHQGHMMKGPDHPEGKMEDHELHEEYKKVEPNTSNTHYMQHGGDGHQGHMMEGKEHVAGAKTEHHPDWNKHEHKSPKGKHYMQKNGDGPQGNMMKGDKHPK